MKVRNNKDLSVFNYKNKALYSLISTNPSKKAPSCPPVVRLIRLDFVSLELSDAYTVDNKNPASRMKTAF